MLSLHNVFSNGALFQQNCVMELRGNAEPKSEIILTLSGDGTETVFMGQADMYGRFAVQLKTPKASMNAYTISVTDGKDTLQLTDILFGELWMAAGQSNMEVPLSLLAEREAFQKSIQGMPIRWYQDNPFFVMKPEFNSALDCPYDPQEDYAGSWKGVDDCMDASALALAACKEIYETQHIPVGFLNCNLGATNIENWLSREVIEASPQVLRTLQQNNRWVDFAHFNQAGIDNIRQPFALFNMVISALQGVKVRGVWWYQGEGNVCYDDTRAYYEEALKAYHILYKRMFAAMEHFPVICALLYPWFYGEEVGNFGELNQAIVECAKEQPNDFSAIAFYDLPPIWGVNHGNHPIHPTHKISLGKRFGRVTLNMAYGYGGLCSAATLSAYWSKEDKLYLKFNTNGHALTAMSKLRNFRLAGKEDIYLDAKAEIVSEDTVVLSHPSIAQPDRAMYQYTEAELYGNLFCDDLPVAPFCTHPAGKRLLPMRPWLHFDQDATWVFGEVIMNEDQCIRNVHTRPIWHPGVGCSLCRDTVFTESGTALCIESDSDTMSAYVLSYPLQRLDLYRFSGMQMDVFTYSGTTVKLQLTIRLSEQEERIMTIEAQVKEAGEDWTTIFFPLSLSECDISKMELIFTVTKPEKYVNIDCLTMVL